jgi:segregation and condensation protein B
VSAQKLAGVLGEETTPTEVRGLLAALEAEYAEAARGFRIEEVAGGFQLRTLPELAPWLQRLRPQPPLRLSRAALETLAIVAYKQPVTRHQISSIRGVNSDGVLRALVDRGVVAEVGREEGPGRPMLYGTTPEFLERLGLPSLASLPPLAPLLGATEEGDAAGPDPG